MTDADPDRDHGRARRAQPRPAQPARGQAQDEQLPDQGPRRPGASARSRPRYVQHIQIVAPAVPKRPLPGRPPRKGERETRTAATPKSRSRPLPPDLLARAGQSLAVQQPLADRLLRPPPPRTARLRRMGRSPTPQVPPPSQEAMTSIKSTVLRLARSALLMRVPLQHRQRIVALEEGWIERFPGDRRPAGAPCDRCGRRRAGRLAPSSRGERPDHFRLSARRSPNWARSSCSRQVQSPSSLHGCDCGRRHSGPWLCCRLPPRMARAPARPPHSAAAASGASCCRRHISA